MTEAFGQARIGWLVGLALLVQGCALTGPAHSPVDERPLLWESEPPPPMQPAPEVPTPVAAPREERFTVDVDNLDARSFFMGLVRDTRYSMVVHPEVTGVITLSVSELTIPEIMEVVRTVYGYEFEPVGSSFLVMPARLQSQVFHVDYLHLRREGLTQTRVTAGEASGEASAGGQGGGQSAGSLISTSSATDLWTELELAVRGIIGDGEGRMVVMSPQANLVVVRGLPSELREVRDFLTSVQDNMNRQVIMEAKILEVQLDDGFQAGINWAALGRPGSRGRELVFGQTGGGTFPGGPSDISGNTGDLDPSNPSLPLGTATSAFGGMFTIAAQLGDFTAFIELLSTQGRVNVLSSPRVSTINNQKAVIKVGSEEFFVTDVSTTTVTGAGATTSTPDITLTPFFSGIALDVTPQINHNREIILHIRPAVTEVVDRVKQLTVAGSDQSLPLAFSTVREADSIVRASSGQIIVIGGLMQDTMSNETARVPVLGDLPGVGPLFRQTRRVSRKTELVILLRPIVVDRDEIWDYALPAAARAADGG